jgi:hypothetical protein
MWLIAAMGCKPEEPEVKAMPELLETTQVSPGPGMPAEVINQPSHNNLDVLWFEDRLYLAIRIAPDHFASTDTIMYVVSSSDGESWDFETSFSMQTDLREPRFLEVNNKLFLYMAVLGSNSLDFEPQGMVFSRKESAGWTEPVSAYLPGFIPWRARTGEDGVRRMIGYIGGENLYDFDEGTVEIHWLQTEDGLNFTPAYPGNREGAIVVVGGGSETDWVFQEDGSVVAVSRNEAGDETGFGSKICKAPAADPGDWTCIHDPRKYDSPLMFSRNNRIYLVGRRNLTETGYYDLSDVDPSYETMSFTDQSLIYAGLYWMEPKRCSLWEVDPDLSAVSWILDLPSRGDTCFPSVVSVPESEDIWLFNYSSPIDGPDLDWYEGQQGETRIYRHRLSLP